MILTRALGEVKHRVLRTSAHKGCGGDLRGQKDKFGKEAWYFEPRDEVIISAPALIELVEVREVR